MDKYHDHSRGFAEKTFGNKLGDRAVLQRGDAYDSIATGKWASIPKEFVGKTVGEFLRQRLGTVVIREKK